MLNYWRNQAHLESNAHIRSILVCCPINSKKKKKVWLVSENVSMGSLPDKNVQINIRFRKKPSGALVCQPWMQLSCCSTFVIFFSQFGFFHLSLSQKTNYFVDSVPLEIFIWKYFHGISGKDLHDSLHDVTGKTEGGHLCVRVRARACMRRNGCDVSTALINSELTEHGDHGDVPERLRLHSDDSSSPRRFDRLTCKSNTCKPASFGRAELQTELRARWQIHGRRTLSWARAPGEETRRDEAGPASLADPPRGEHPPSSGQHCAAVTGE